MEETAFSSSPQKTSDILENFVNLCFIERDKEEGETTTQHLNLILIKLKVTERTDLGLQPFAVMQPFTQGEVP